MLKKIGQFLRDLGHEGLETPSDVVARFRLRYEDIDIGTLWLDRGVWHFAYSEGFKAQSVAKPLVDFPDTDRTYSSEELWPFFAVRIPSLQQPAVREIAEKENLDIHNEVAMLARFARRSLSSPFSLEAL